MPEYPFVGSYKFSKSINWSVVVTNFQTMLLASVSHSSVHCYSYIHRKCLQLKTLIQ